MSTQIAPPCIQPWFPRPAIYNDFQPPNLLTLGLLPFISPSWVVRDPLVSQNLPVNGIWTDFQPPNLLVSLLKSAQPGGPYVPVDVGGWPFLPLGIYTDFQPPNAIPALANTQAPVFYANPGPRFWIYEPPRAFTISAVNVQTFEAKNPLESVLLVFDFSPDLQAGEQLKPSPNTQINLIAGQDPTPGNIVNGTPGFDATFTRVIVPVKGGNAGCDYQIVMTCNTTNALKTLTLIGVLPVRFT